MCQIKIIPLLIALSTVAHAQWVITTNGTGAGGVVISSTGGGGVVGGVTDANYYDNLDGSCRNMGTDGPAALPNRCYNTSLGNTPSPGATFWVCPPLQTTPSACASTTYHTITAAFAAIGGAIPCGSTIKIVSTTTGAPSGIGLYYDEANLTYPAVACNASAWITVETDQVVAAEGTRISPAWLGAASLPDRPAYNQPATLGVYMPKIRNTAFNQPALKFAQVASTSGPVPSYVRFIGLNFVQPGPGSSQCSGHDCQTGWQNSIVESNCISGGVVCPDHVIFDRVIVGPDDVTGTSTYLVCTGIRLTGTSMAVIDSYIYEIAGSSGYCETHAIGFGNANGALNQGPYKLINNFIEAGAENTFTGGGYSVSGPADIQIRRNHMYKPRNLWMPGQPGYLGVPMLAKNLSEMKHALRALIEGNVYENSWYGHDANNVFVSDQFGYGVLLNSAAGDLTDLQHHHWVEDITFRYNVVRHTVRGMAIDSEDCQSSKLVGCGIYPPGSSPTLLQRVSVHDNLFDDISPKFVTGAGAFNGFDGTAFALTNSAVSVPPTGILNSVTISHNTVMSNSYRQSITIASIVVTAGTATLTSATATPVVTVGQRVAVFGSCAGFNNNNVTVVAVTQTSPVLAFTYTTGATGTCNQGFVSTLGETPGGAFNMNEGASDSPITSVSETGNLAQALLTHVPSFKFCVAVGTPAGCTQQATFTIHGLSGSLACYNTNQTSSACPPSGTPAAWTLVGRVSCSGAGAGTVTGNASASQCTASGQEIVAWNHPQSGLPTANANADSYYSYWLNPGPNPNPVWQDVVFSNNIVAGRVQQNSGVCQHAPQLHSDGVLSQCGVLATTGPGAYQFTCNVVAARQLIGQGNLADTLPATNSNTSDSTFNTVGFVNYNFDNLGQGVSGILRQARTKVRTKIAARINNWMDLALAPSSAFYNGISGCGGVAPGANMTQIQTYTSGVL